MNRNLRYLPFSGYGSHIPVLYKCLKETTGPILECGIGFNSTPITHQFSKDRKVYSLEAIGNWYKLFTQYENENHKIIHVDKWENFKDFILSEQWSIIFVDQRPQSYRGWTIELVQNNAEFVIAHDTQDVNLKKNHYKHHHLLKYKNSYRYEAVGKPYTTVVSNVREIPDFSNALDEYLVSEHVVNCKQLTLEGLGK
jgi:hypothetical protein